MDGEERYFPKRGRDGALLGHDSNLLDYVRAQAQIGTELSDLIERNPIAALYVLENLPEEVPTDSFYAAIAIKLAAEYLRAYGQDEGEARSLPADLIKQLINYCIDQSDYL